MLRLLTLFLLSFSLSCSASAKSVQVPAERAIHVVGPILFDAILNAHKVERMSAESSDDIHILINSPGGMVQTGLQLVKAMDIARSRGVTVKCYVGFLAASMAFQLLPHCSNRYALAHSLLLFHPARADVKGLTEEIALDVHLGLKSTNSFILEELRTLFNNPAEEWLLFHFKAETMWDATELVNQTGDWLEIVDDIQTESGIFSIEPNMNGPGNSKVPRGFLYYWTDIFSK